MAGRQERGWNLRLPALVGAALFALLMAVHSGRLYSIDGLEYYRTADRIVSAGSATLDPPLVWGGPIRAPVTPIGYSLALVPAVALAWPLRFLQPSLVSDLAYNSALLYGDSFYAAVSWVNPLFAALTGALVVAIVRRLGGGPRLAVAAGLATVLSGPLLWYARADFPQPLTTVLLVASVLMVLRVRSGEGGVLWLTPIVAWAVLTRPVDGLLTALVAGLGLLIPDHRPSVTPPRPWHMVTLVAGVAIGAAGLMVVNMAARGSPLNQGIVFGFKGFFPAGLLAYLVSPGRSFFWHLPLALLGIAGIRALWRRRERVPLVLLGLPIVLWFPVYAQWIGLSGWAYGPRFLVPLVPLAVVLAAVAVARSGAHSMRKAFGALAVVGCALATSAVVVDQFGFFGIIGVNQWGTPGYWREFTLAAYAPIASWATWTPTSIGQLADVYWLRIAEVTGGLSLLVPLALGVLAAALAALAWRLAGSSGLPGERTALAAADSASAA